MLSDQGLIDMKNVWHLAHGKRIDLLEEAILMGILNITPDSFSDGGSYFCFEKAIAAAHRMIGEGAHIIDVGGESTRPGAQAVDSATEQARVLEVVSSLAADGIIISVDTYRAETAYLAVKAGAHIINDVWGLQKDSSLSGVVGETGAGVVVMHTGRGRERTKDVMADQKNFFYASLDIAHQAGIKDEQIVLDPGFGFAKTRDENIALMRHASDCRIFGFPLLAGTSRKRFIGDITNKKNPRDRDIATGATCVILRMSGFNIFRVHNISVNRDALAIADALRRGGRSVF
ncbi:MAG: dihydropteroate synthase [Candidatus Tokpelaia sp. JSC161]|jgi:dihydropteroate synthase|nr:MAG: dihydropteroate synthase [Candidatus Tokpelaia sp. JSC161]